MGRIATTEDVEGLRDQEDVGDVVQKNDEEGDDGMSAEDKDESEAKPITENRKGKYVATLQDVHDAFDAVNTLRYSQPTHLQGKIHYSPSCTHY